MVSFSRRLAVQAVIAASLPTLPAAAMQAGQNPISQPSADRELLSLCRRYMSLERRQNRLMELMLDANSRWEKAYENRLYEMQCRFVPYGHELLAEVMEAPARTAEGLRAKVEVCVTRIQRDQEGNPSFEDLPLWSLCRDLLGHDRWDGV